MNLSRALIEAINKHVEIPPDIALLITRCNRDLYFGPIYLDGEGNECSMFEFERKPQQFDFSGTVTKLRTWCEKNLSVDMYYNRESGELTIHEPVFGPSDAEDDTPYECPEDWEVVDRYTIRRVVLGRELARHI